MGKLMLNMYLKVLNCMTLVNFECGWLRLIVWLCHCVVIYVKVLICVVKINWKLLGYKQLNIFMVLSAYNDIDIDNDINLPMICKALILQSRHWLLLCVIYTTIWSKKLAHQMGQHLTFLHLDNEQKLSYLQTCWRPQWSFWTDRWWSRRGWLSRGRSPYI